MANENANKKGKLATYLRGVRLETKKSCMAYKKRTI